MLLLLFVCLSGRERSLVMSNLGLLYTFKWCRCSFVYCWVLICNCSFVLIWTSVLWSCGSSKTCHTSFVHCSLVRCWMFIWYCSFVHTRTSVLWSCGSSRPNPGILFENLATESTAELVCLSTSASSAGYIGHACNGIISKLVHMWMWTSASLPGYIGHARTRL